MSHNMNTMPTVRRGRTYYKHGANDNRGLGGVCSVIAIVALLIVPPLILVGSERSRRTRYIALSDALDSDIVELNHHDITSRDLLRLRPSTLVHGTSSRIDALSVDPDMRVSVPGALVLRRNTEYCQWQEVQSQRCETCTRSVRANDGSTKEERYQCNCVKHYDYIKAWRNRRINSLLFDQPGAHHNPQRDPMPSRVFVDDNAKLTFPKGVFDGEHDTDDEGNTQQNHYEGGGHRHHGPPIVAHLDPNMLSNGVRNQPQRNVEFVPNGHAPPPSFFSKLFSFFGGYYPRRRTRYEPLRRLKDTPDSPAAIHDNFVYVSQGGYFFSAYESPSTSSKLFNWFAQYMEGSLFDWQLGDLMPSCTAGDVRFTYSVQDPAVVSVLGQLGGSEGEAVRIAPRTMNGIGDKAAATIGLVHAGRSGPRAMLEAEDSASKTQAHVIRALMFLWSVPASRLLGVGCGCELGESSFTSQLEGSLGMFLTLLGTIWLVVWGSGSIGGSSGGTESYGMLETSMIFFLGGVLGWMAHKSAVRKAGGGSWNAIWCRVAKWANVPPEWRVEDSYVPPPVKVEGGARSKLS
mmetsp:Transcript_9464/g.16463  ORF Transcript_9464/g.16463 Transcript_9464/m.16463 type:complete len:574 (-) Transcript_9464:117-1838(-)